MIQNDEAEDGVRAQTGILCMSAQHAEKIRNHGAKAYPHECCGALLGRPTSDMAQNDATREILAVVPLENRREDSPRNRFLVAPKDVLQVEKAAKVYGLEVVGWYHSHPDHPARPSKCDLENAWPWYSYVILRVQDGFPQEMASWRLRDDRAKFFEEKVELRDQAPSS